ncbi:ABC transporter substrate-binding protein [Pantoea sp. 18069]|uniref:ABC transporter substrate-binding protein n=1 Tax=Pantoea sp. 18069 TaxID=2681415 RepID=UPI00190F9D42|nr:ABC transporter substrate-binding protein [Pantoea sp. 18069]
MYQASTTPLTRFANHLALGMALAGAAGAALAQGEAPKYGGTLNFASTSAGVATLSWDLVDWQATLQTRDTGQFYEQLFAVDLSKAKSRGGKYPFTISGWQPTDSVRGELAESWSWPTPLKLEVKLRQGVKFPAKKGVMAERELVAEDIVFNFNRMNTSPKRTQGYYDHIDKVEATGKHTVVFHFNKYIADWDYRFGNGFFSGIVPKEVVDAGAGSWKNVNGTGPFMLTNVAQGNALTFSKNPVYWDKLTVAGKSYQLPFVDRVVHRVIKDESTQQSALRTGKLDILSSISWEAAKELKKSTPQLQWNRWLTTSAPRVALRVDTKPFNDVRVRRALNMAVNKQEIVDKFYGGEAALFTFPMHPEYLGYHKPLSEQPASVQELFKYDPARARKLLTEAGYPNGFAFKMQICSCNVESMELMPLVAAYLEGVGVKMEITPMEYGAHLSAMTSHTNAAGYLTAIPDVNPTTSLRINFGKDQVYNAPMMDDAQFDARVAEANGERDEARRQQMLRELTAQVLDQAPAIWMPAPYRYTAWWPWVKNYGGEMFVGAGRMAPIHAQLWIDQDLKKKMGF